MAEGFSSPIDTGLPGNPANVPEELYEEFNKIYAGIRILQQKLGEYAGTGVLDLANYLSTIKPTIAESIQSQRMNAILVTASAAISAGQMVNLHSSSGLKVRAAQANALSTRAHGWAPAAIANGDIGLIYLLQGLNQAVSGLTVAATYYLSSATPGGITTTAPVAAGTISQEVGFALSATELMVTLGQRVVVN